MLQASISLGSALLAAALLLPVAANATGQMSLSPPQVQPATHATVPHAAVKLQDAKAPVAKPPAMKPAHVIYAHPLRVQAPSQALVSRPHRREVALRRSDASPPPGAIAVSTRGLNRFVFPAPVVKGPIFPADAPVLGAPVYLDGNRQVLVQFMPGSDKPFGMVVELAGHQVESYLLAPRDIPDMTYHARGVRPPPSISRPTSSHTIVGRAHQAEITLLRSVVMGEVPDAFYPTQLPPAVHFDKFNIVPRASWSDGSGHRILVYALVSARGQAAVVAAPEFYHKGMAAILLSGDVVDATHSPLLYILEGARRG